MLRFGCLTFVLLVLLAAYPLAARFLLHGPVTATSLAGAVTDASGSAGGLLDEPGECERLVAPRTWRCGVLDSSGSGGVDYRVQVRASSSCFDARRTRDYGEGGTRRSFSGCVYRWRWSLLDLL